MESQRQWEIYTLSDPRDGRVRYVGVTHCGVQFRHRAHIQEAKKGQRGRKQDWIRSLLALAMKPDVNVIESGIGPSWEDAERKWIAFYRESDPNLINVEDGGRGRRFNLGKKLRPVSQETRERMAASQRGKKQPPRSAEWQAKLTAAHKGKKVSESRLLAMKRAAEKRRGIPVPLEIRRKRGAAIKAHRALHPLTDEQRAAISARQIGNKMSDESRSKMAAAKLGVKRGPHSEETIAKIRASNIGKVKPPTTLETRAKRSVALRGKPWSDARRLAEESRLSHGHSEATKIKLRSAYNARGKEKNAEIRAKQIASHKASMAANS